MNGLGQDRLGLSSVSVISISYWKTPHKSFALWASVSSQVSNEEEEGGGGFPSSFVRMRDLIKYLSEIVTILR